MSTFLPHSGSVWTGPTAGQNTCIPGSNSQPTWFGVKSAQGGVGGSAAFYAGASSTGSQFSVISAPCGDTVMQGPVLVPEGIHIAGIASGSVIGWTGRRVRWPNRAT